jgi:hypothetical protein
MGKGFWYVPAILRGKGKRIKIQGQPGQIMRPYLKNKTKSKGLGSWLKSQKVACEALAQAPVLGMGRNQKL